MYIRSEKRAWSVNGTFLTPGASMEIDQATLTRLRHLIDKGELAVFENDPSPKKKAEAPKAEDKPKADKPKATRKKRSTKKKASIDNAE